MPELPEVESVRRGLAHHLAGRRITDVRTMGSRVIRHSPAGLGEFIGQRVTDVVRRGKFLWVTFGGARTLVAHLGMSGQFRLDGGDFRHTRAEFTLDDHVHLFFVDQRTFGYLAADTLIPTPDGAPGGAGTHLAAVPARVAHIARDPLDPAFDVVPFAASIRSSRSTIKQLLLDQKRVSGVGNIYADEALWHAQLNPHQRGRTLQEAEVYRLVEALRDVLGAALKAGGTSFDELYVNVNGESGYFARSLRAYGRAGLPCQRCGNLMRRDVIGGRSATYCGACQPLRRRVGQ